MVEPTPHIAVLFSGAFRTLTDCNETIARHVIDANPWARFDVYAHLSSDVTSEAERQRMEASVRFGSACIAAVRLETNAAVSAGVRRELPHLDRLPSGRGTARGKAGTRRRLGHTTSMTSPIVAGRTDWTFCKSCRTKECECEAWTSWKRSDQR